MGACITTLRYAQEQSGVLLRLHAALRDAAAWGNSHLDESAEIIAQVSKIDIGVVKNMHRSHYSGDLFPRDLQPPIDLAARYSFLSTDLPARDPIWSGK